MLPATTATALLLCGLGCVLSAPTTVQQKKEVNTPDFNVTAMYTMLDGGNVRLSVTCKYSAPFLLEGNSGRYLATLAIKRRPRSNEVESGQSIEDDSEPIRGDLSGDDESDKSTDELQQLMVTAEVPNIRAVVIRALELQADQAEGAQTQVGTPRGEGSEDESYSEMVAVNVESKFGVAEDFHGTYEGQLDQENKRAILTVHWESISWEDLGDYQCVATTVDYQGNCHHDTQILDPNVLTHPTLEGLRGKLSECESKAKEAGISAAAAAATIKKLEEEKAALKSQITRGSMTMSMTNMAKHTIYWMSAWYKNSVYVLTKEKDTCADIGGYLVEINSEEEFLFINKTVRTPGFGLPSGACCLATGASYPGLGEPFEFATHPEDHVYLGHWDDGEPDRDNMDRNALVLRLEDGSLEMIDGLPDSGDTPYLCEVTAD